MKSSATNHNSEFRISTSTRSEFGFRNKTAASLAEILIAVAILSISVVAIIGTMLIAQKGSRLTRDRLIASNLAREGIEIVRSIRDSNWINCSQDKTKWFVTGSCTSSLNYTDDDLSNEHKKTQFNTTTGKWLLLNQTATDGVFNQNFQLKLVTYDSAKVLTYSTDPLGEKSRFYRKVKLNFEQNNNPSDSNYVMVTSTVGWTDSSGLTQDIEIKEQLFNWQ